MRAVDDPSVPGSLLLTVLKRWVLCNSNFVIIEVSVLYRVSYFVVSYLYMYVRCSGLITSVGEERANFSAIVYL